MARQASRRARNLTGLDELMGATRVITAAVAHSLASINAEVSMPQLRVLVMVSAQGSMNLSAVADGLGVSPSNASRAVDRLVGMGMLDRVDAPHDRRHVALTLTDHGEQVLETVMSHRRAILAQVIEGMKENDRRSLAQGMEAFRASAAAMSAEGKLDDGAGHLLRWLG